MKPTDKGGKVPLKAKTLALLLCGAVRILYATLRVTVRNEAEVEALCQQYGSVILVTWHGRSLVPIARSVGKGYYGMVSLSRDGDLLNECFRRLGWRTIRGSTGRAGARAMKAAIDVMNVPGTVLAITPDGPRGPGRRIQPGVVYLARKCGRPIVPVGIGMERSWQANSWDRFGIPLPFSRVQWLYGEPIFIASNDDIASTCQRLEWLINTLEDEATATFLVPEREWVKEHSDDVRITRK